MKCKKRTYRFAWFAMKHLQWIKKNSDSNYTPIRVYKCFFCEGYHLTSHEKLTTDEIRINKAKKDFKNE